MSKRAIVADDRETCTAARVAMINAFAPGTQVDVVGDGRELVDKVRTNNYDLAFTDNEMPVMGGLEAIKEIRIFDKVLPIYMIAGSSDESLPARAIAAGATGYIAKLGPEEFAQTRDAVRKHLNP